MACSPGYHETPISTLFGSATTPSTTEKICAPDSHECGDFSFECAIEAYKKVQGDELAMATVQSVGQLASFYASGGLSVIGEVLQGVGAEQGDPNFSKAANAFNLATSATTLDLAGGNMGFFDSIGDFDFSSVVDSTYDMMEGVDWGQVVDVGQTAFQTYQDYTTPVMAKAPQVIQKALPSLGGAGGAVARAGATVGRSFFNKWPNLAVAIQKMKNAGQNVSRSKLYSMLKRFGPEFLVTAGIMSAAAVSELALAGPGHRRMNPANSKALRRAQRRLKTFHRLCVHTDALKPHKRRR